jgi:hypothetical protein
MEFKCTSSLHSSYLKQETINTDVISLDLLGLQKVTSVSKHESHLVKTARSPDVDITYDSNFIYLQYVC